MATYEGRRSEDGVVVTVDGRRLPPRNDLFNHSPDGFEYGYGGSGPAQLALAILAHHTKNDELAVKLHQKFKFNMIAPLPREAAWSISSDAVAEFVQAHG